MSRSNVKLPVVTLLLFVFVSSTFETRGSENRAADDDISSETAVDENIFTKEKAWITGNLTFPEAILHTATVTIGSFNMKQYGPKKSKNEDVLRIIAKIVSRYDLIALQEITDAKGRAIKTLISAINKESPHPFQYIVSPRVGRSKQKEQYGLFYRPSVFQVKNYLVFNDSNGDAFSREPLIAEAVLKQNGEKFGLINVHVAPRDAAKEIDALADVHAWTEKHMRLKNIIILGDLNADCDYIRKKDIPNIRLMNDNKYTWLIPNKVDTTVGNSNCAYDRIIVSGPYLKSERVGYAQAFEFDRQFSLERDAALTVSDHYPVQFSVVLKSPSSNVHPEVLYSTAARATSLIDIALMTIFLRNLWNSIPFLG